MVALGMVVLGLVVLGMVQVPRKLVRKSAKNNKRKTRIRVKKFNNQFISFTSCLQICMRSSLVSLLALGNAAARTNKLTGAFYKRFKQATSGSFPRINLCN
jgi:hypothetical protein